MKTIIRNFLSALRRFKMAMLLNILGLSVAFAAFIIIMMQLDYDHNFDKFHPDYDKIFRIELINKNEVQAIFNRPMSELIFASSPHIIAGTLSSPWGTKTFFKIEENGIQHSYEENMVMTSPEYMDVFTFDFVEGTKDVLKEPGHVAIPLSLSRKFFGNQSAVGKQMIGRDATSTIGAVFAISLPIR